jgi:transposase
MGHGGSMEDIERRVAREVRAMTRREVMVKAIDKQITWIAAAAIIGVSDRQMRRLKRRYEECGVDGVMDQRGGRPRRRRIPIGAVEEVMRLKREKYPDFSVRHFYEHLVEHEGVEVSYSWTLRLLEEAGIVQRAPARGKYRRRRERRPMTGMLIHLDASTHRWIPELEMQDLVVALDDADGRILFARFYPEEGTRSTLEAVRGVVLGYGRFCELYTDRGAHFCKTPVAGAGPAEEQNGQVSRVMRALGIRQIFARSPEARGRSERNFGTLQGRVPQELRLHGIDSYERANQYLEDIFVPDFNRRFTERPALKEKAFVRVGGTDLELVLSIQHHRTVSNDNVVSLRGLELQLPPTRLRPTLARCPVTVHELLDGTIAVSFQGRAVARFAPDGSALLKTKPNRKAA